MIRYYGYEPLPELRKYQCCRGHLLPVMRDKTGNGSSRTPTYSAEPIRDAEPEAVLMEN